MFGRNRLGQYGVQGMGDIPRLPQMEQPDPNEIRMNPQAQAAMANAPRKKEKKLGYWQGGEKFGWGDAAITALAAIGDASSVDGTGNATRTLLGGRMSAIEQAKAAQAASQQAAERQAAAERMGINPDQLALLGGKLGDVVADRMKPQEAAKPGSFEWWSDPSRTEQEKATFAAYRDANTPDEPRMITLPDGRAVFGTMSEIERMLGGGAVRPARPVGGLTPIGGGTGSNVGGGFR